jgi:hypothetical protein
MRILCVLASIGLLLGMTCTAEAAKSKKAKAVSGTVISVKPDSDKDTGSFTVKVKPKKKKDAPVGEPEEKTIKVTSSTTFESLTGKKKNAISAPAKFSDLSDGKTVTFTANGDTATDVKMFSAKKKKKVK